ncbi:MAG: fumarate reductase subunit C [bacterium]
MPATWWLRQRAYFLFMLREWTSVVIAVYLALLLLMLNRLAAGPQSYEAYLRWLATPGMVLFHVVAFAAAFFHTVTWFNITPKVLVVRVGERRIPEAIVAGANYLAWIAVSIVLAWVLLRS